MLEPETLQVLRPEHYYYKNTICACPASPQAGVPQVLSEGHRVDHGDHTSEEEGAQTH